MNKENNDVSKYLEIIPNEIKRIIHALDGDKYRTGILVYLMDNKATSKELSENFGIEESIVKAHLNELSKGALVRAHIEGDLRNEEIYEASQVAIKTTDGLLKTLELE